MYTDNEVNAVRNVKAIQNNVAESNETLKSIMDDINGITGEIDAKIHRIGKIFFDINDTAQAKPSKPECFMIDLRAHLEYLHQINYILCQIDMRIC